MILRFFFSSQRQLERDLAAIAAESEKEGGEAAMVSVQLPLACCVLRRVQRLLTGAHTHEMGDTLHVHTFVHTRRILRVQCLLTGAHTHEMGDTLHVHVSCLGSSVGRVLCLEYRVSWVRVPPEAAHFF